MLPATSPANPEPPVENSQIRLAPPSRLSPRRRAKSGKNANPNFFAANLLIFLNQAENSFGNIWRAQRMTIEIIGIFMSRRCRNRVPDALSPVFAGLYFGPSRNACHCAGWP